MKAFLLDIDYILRKNRSGVRLLLRTLSGKTTRAYDYSFEPYFLLDADEKKADALKRIAGVKRVETTIRSGKTFLKITCNRPSDVPMAAAAASMHGKTYEQAIQYVRRYLIDKKIVPCAPLEIEADEENEVTLLRQLDGHDEMPSLRMASFDIETYNPTGMPDAKRDPCIMIGCSASKDVLFTTKKYPFEFVRTVPTEKDMLESFSAFLREERADVLCTYNGDEFDLPYLAERARQTKAQLRLGRTKALPVFKRLGLRNTARVNGRVHFDVFNVVSFMSKIGALRMPRLSLDKVYEEVLGKKKEDIAKLEIWKAWDRGDAHLAKYCRSDAVACLELARHYLPLEIELARVSGTTLHDASRATTGQLVEALLMRRAAERGELIPNKPEQAEAEARQAAPIQGAFVKIPEPGIYENIAVFDFRSLYPSIIISHNVDPATIGCKEEDAYVSPLGHRFCKKKEGLIPSVLGEVLEARFAAKKAMKSAEGNARSQLDARQWALKIIANSFYGYLLYARSRWYSRECGESVTAWGRHFIQDTMRKAEEAGFKVLYGDSITADRCVILLDNQHRLHVKNVGEFFEENAERTIRCGEKEVIPLPGWSALSVNPSTKKTEWKNVTELIRHRTDKTIYRVNQKFGETRVTEDHSLMADTPAGLVETRPMDIGNKKIAQAPVPSVEPTVSELDVYDVLKGYNVKTAYKGRTKTGRTKCDSESVTFGWTERKQPVKVKRFVKVGTPEFESLCRLLAAYAAEGSSSTIETTHTRNGASIAGKREWLEELRRDYESLFSAKASVIRSTMKTRHLDYRTSRGAKKTIVYDDVTFKLQMMNSLSAVFFKMFCGQTSRGKKLPDFIYNVPKKHQLAFLKKLLEGDGSRSVNKKLGYSEEYKKRNFRYSTVSTRLASGLSVLLRQLGINHTVRRRAYNGEYVLSTSSRYNQRFKTRIAAEAYDGWVYDLSVEDNHTFVDACGQLVLHNTDSIMLQYIDEKKVLEFQKKINAELPEKMELELEDIYPRGIFVAKKQGERGAKKKYALINREGKIKIRGFELVRRDWSRVARRTQRDVLEILLREGDVKKAVALVRKVVEELRAGKTPIEDLTIHTQLRKKNYEVKSPELGAVEKARAAGIKVPDNSLVSYVITKSGKTISEKAEFAETAKDYDAEYYVNNQVLPAVLKILGAFGYDEDGIKLGGTQKGLGSW